MYYIEPQTESRKVVLVIQQLGSCIKMNCCSIISLLEVRRSMPVGAAVRTMIKYVHSPASQTQSLIFAMISI